MDWLQVLTIAGSTIGAVWFVHRDNLSFQNDMKNEMKDFHGRLCRLEEKYIQMMQRFMEERNK
jgi:hypothetical protein